MGTYHIIDGMKTRVLYRGNKRTCGRCHNFASNCPGNAIAKTCEESGGKYVPLSEHMRKLWTEINFTPTGFELNEDDSFEDFHIGKEQMISIVERFPPQSKVTPTKRDVDMYDGVNLNNFPINTKEEDIMKILKDNGMPDEITKEQLIINEKKKNKSVTINGLDRETITSIISEVDFHESNKKFFGNPIYCKPVRNITPVKETHEAVKSSPKDASAEEEKTSPTSSDNLESDAGDEPQNITKEVKKASEEHLQTPNIPGLHISKSAMKRQRKKQAELKLKESMNPKETEVETGHTRNEEKSPSPSKETLEERWLNNINSLKHKHSPEEEVRSVRSRSVSLLE